MKLIIIIWMITLKLCADDCSSALVQRYQFEKNREIVNYILLNYSEIISDLHYTQLEKNKLESLLTQLNLPNNDKTLNYLIELVNSSKNSYDFAMALTKDKN